MQEVNHEKLVELIYEAYETKLPLFVYGGFGIGKSETTLTTAMQLAEDRGKDFLEWNRIPKEKKYELIENPKPYFVLVDERLAQDEPSDLKGLPDLNGRESVEWKPPLWVRFATQEEADGVLFFDEANLSPPSVQSAFYQIVHDRESGSHPLSDKIAVISAGNRLEDKSNVYEMSEALKDRYIECELTVPSVEDWTDWAMENGIDSRVISYLNFKRTHIYKAEFDNKNKSTTPRGWERVSRMISGVDNDELDKIRLFTGSSIGEGIAQEFCSFIKLQQKIDLEEFIENPTSVEMPAEISVKYSLVSGVIDWYVNNRSEESLRKVFRLADRFEPELQVLLLRFAKDKGGEQFFGNHIKNIPEWKNVAERFSKYLLD